MKLGRDSDDVDELFITTEDLIYYNGMYYGDWSVLSDTVFGKEDKAFHQVYDSAKAKPPKKEKTTEPDLAEPSVKIVVYVRGGMCQDVVTNLPDDTWEYALVDYDNEPDLPENYIPFSKDQMQIVPLITNVNDLVTAVQHVIANWETGDLAGSVRQLAAVLAQAESLPQEKDNCYTVYGYHTEHKCPFAHWVAANNVDEAKTVIAQQYPAVVICGVVKGWLRLD